MYRHIILTREQAEFVKGNSRKNDYSVLRPIERANSIFILTVAVLLDPAHEQYKDFLSNLPQLDENDSEFPVELELLP